MRALAIVAVGAAVVAIAAAVWIYLFSGVINRSASFEIVGVTARESFGLDYSIIVLCSIYNSGASGSATIIAELEGDGFWRRTTTEFVPEHATREIAVVFDEPTFLGVGLGRYEYTCFIP